MRHYQPNNNLTRRRLLKINEEITELQEDISTLSSGKGESQLLNAKIERLNFLQGTTQGLTEEVRALKRSIQNIKE